MPRNSSGSGWGRENLFKWLLRLVPAVALLGAWLYASGPGGTSTILLPKLSNTISEFASLATTQRIWAAMGLTAVQVLVAFAIASTLTFIVASIASRTQKRSLVVEPLLAWGYMAPSIVFYPMFILWFDIGVWSKIAYAASNAFFPMALGALRGLMNIDRGYIRTAWAFGASPRQLEWDVKFRAALPMMLSSLRIGAALSMISVILAEMLAAVAGVGYELARASQTLETARVFALVVLIMILVGFYQPLINRIELDYRTR